MCVLLFSPERAIEITFATESVKLSSKGRKDVTDLLFTNNSSESVEKIHLVYPHALPRVSARSQGVKDITQTLLKKDSPYNAFYREENGATLRIEGTEVTVVLTRAEGGGSRQNPTGKIRGSQQIVPYDFSGLDGASDLAQSYRWQILGGLRLSAYTIEFEVPVAAGESRWVRLEACIPRQPLTARLRRGVLRHVGRLRDCFEITGPLDIQRRLDASLGSAQDRSLVPNLTPTRVLVALDNLRYKLVDRGIRAPKTSTTIKDWRLNVAVRYRRCEPVHTFGDIVDFGPVTPELSSGDESEFHLWKAGDDNVPSKQQAGQFRVRIQASDASWLYDLSGWLGVFLAAFGLVLCTVPGLPGDTFRVVAKFIHWILRRHG